jgi:hypothetical protein
VCRGMVREREQWSAKEEAASKIKGQILRCDRLFLLSCIPRVGHYPKMEARIL